MRKFELEVCVDDVDDAMRAVDAGATRIEMNSGLACDGLTPRIACCRWLSQNCAAPVVAMLRPHDVGFRYSDVQKKCLLEDAQALLDAGVDGLVSGALTQSNQIDLTWTSQLVDLCGGREFIFHRAFDLIADQKTAVRKLVDVGVTRVLTSGGAASAMAGAPVLRELMGVAGGDLEILPGAGVRPENIESLVKQVGCTQVHGSFRYQGGFEADSAPLNGPDVAQIRAAHRLLSDLFEH